MAEQEKQHISRKEGAEIPLVTKGVFRRETIDKAAQGALERIKNLGSDFFSFLKTTHEQLQQKAVADGLKVENLPAAGVEALKQGEQGVTKIGEQAAQEQITKEEQIQQITNEQSPATPTEESIAAPTVESAGLPPEQPPVVSETIPPSEVVTPPSEPPIEQEAPKEITKEPVTEISPSEPVPEKVVEAKEIPEGVVFPSVGEDQPAVTPEITPSVTPEIQDKAKQIIKDFEGGGAPLVIVRRSRETLKAHGFTDDQIENKEPAKILEELKVKVLEHEYLEAEAKVNKSRDYIRNGLTKLSQQITESRKERKEDQEFFSKLDSAQKIDESLLQEISMYLSKLSSSSESDSSLNDSLIQMSKETEEIIKNGDLLREAIKKLEPGSEDEKLALELLKIGDELIADSQEILQHHKETVLQSGDKNRDKEKTESALSPTEQPTEEKLKVESAKEKNRRILDLLRDLQSSDSIPELKLEWGEDILNYGEGGKLESKTFKAKLDKKSKNKIAELLDNYDLPKDERERMVQAVASQLEERFTKSIEHQAQLEASKLWKYHKKKVLTYGAAGAAFTAGVSVTRMLSGVGTALTGGGLKIAKIAVSGVMGAGIGWARGAIIEKLQPVLDKLSKDKETESVWDNASRTKADELLRQENINPALRQILREQLISELKLPTNPKAELSDIKNLLEQQLPEEQNKEVLDKIAKQIAALNGLGRTTENKLTDYMKFVDDKGRISQKARGVLIGSGYGLGMPSSTEAASLLEAGGTISLLAPSLFGAAMGAKLYGDPIEKFFARKRIEKINKEIGERLKTIKQDSSSQELIYAQALLESGLLTHNPVLENQARKYIADAAFDGRLADSEQVRSEVKKLHSDLTRKATKNKIAAGSIGALIGFSSGVISAYIGRAFAEKVAMDSQKAGVGITETQTTAKVIPPPTEVPRAKSDFFAPEVTKTKIIEPEPIVPEKGDTGVQAEVGFLASQAKDVPTMETVPSKQAPVVEVQPTKPEPIMEVQPSKQEPVVEVSKQKPIVEVQPSKQEPKVEAVPSKKETVVEAPPDKKPLPVELLFGQKKTGQAVEFSVGRGKDVTYLDQGLRRAVADLYKPEGETFTATDAAKIENSLANLRELAQGHDVAGLKAADFKGAMSWDGKSFKVLDQSAFTNKVGTLFGHSQEVITPKSDAYAYVKENQQVYEQKFGKQMEVEDFSKNELVQAAESRLIAAAQAAAESIPGTESKVGDYTWAQGKNYHDITETTSQYAPKFPGSKELHLYAVDADGDKTPDFYVLGDTDDVVEVYTKTSGEPMEDFVSRVSQGHKELALEIQATDKALGKQAQDFNTIDKAHLAATLGLEQEGGNLTPESQKILQEAVGKLGPDAGKYLRDHDLGAYIKSHLPELGKEELHKLFTEGAKLRAAGWQSIDYGMVDSLLESGRGTDGNLLDTNLKSPLTEKTIKISFTTKDAFTRESVAQAYNKAVTLHTKELFEINNLKNQFEAGKNLGAFKNLPEGTIAKVLKMDANSSLEQWQAQFGGGNKNITLDKLFKEINLRTGGRLGSGVISGTVGDNLEQAMLARPEAPPPPTKSSTISEIPEPPETKQAAGLVEAVDNKAVLNKTIHGAIDRELTNTEFYKKHTEIKTILQEINNTKDVAGQLESWQTTAPAKIQILEKLIDITKQEGTQNLAELKNYLDTLNQTAAK